MKKTFSERLYGFLWHLLRWPVKKIFAFTCDEDRQEEPTLIISNHVTNFDPILVAYSFPGRRFHFVASEHLFRMGFVSKLLTYVFEPVARRKVSAAAIPRWPACESSGRAKLWGSLPRARPLGTARPRKFSLPPAAWPRWASAA